MNKIGDRIKQRREELGLSVDDVAKLLGKHRATIYRYESDEIEKFPTNVLEPLAAALQTTPSALMGWDDFIAEAEELDKRHREGAKCFGEGVTSIDDNNESVTLIFKETLHRGRLSHDEERILLSLYQLTNLDKDRGIHTLRILCELVSVMSQEDQMKLISYAEFMEADRQKRLGISVQHPYQFEQEQVVV